MPGIGRTSAWAHTYIYGSREDGESYKTYDYWPQRLIPRGDLKVLTSCEVRDDWAPDMTFPAGR
jgi:hypothetical protein